MNKTISLIGIPSSAGAHWPGQEKTPQYLRDAGLIKQLEKGGFDIADFGDLPLVRFRPDKENRNKQNWKKVLEVATGVSGKVASALEKETTLLIIGGDCTISLGVIAGFITKEEIQEREDYIKSSRAVHMELLLMPVDPLIEAAKICNENGVLVSVDLDISPRYLYEYGHADRS